MTNNNQSHFDRYYGHDHRQFVDHYEFNHYGHNGDNYSDRYNHVSSYENMTTQGQSYTMTEAMNQYRSIVAKRYALPNTGQSDELSLEYLLLLVGSLLFVKRQSQTAN
ncbi:hypothetical protein [Staphylococcus aureus]|uniref:hypothetical protein n=1 Tax=Staphylococcus aureus TaxID=1280 RepID=UPI000F083EAC|nr:hypothetical protein [Staphylococcus aureus]RNB40225.1 hypothetical protein EDM29_14305 [Staphylococcus aureus]